MCERRLTMSGRAKIEGLTNAWYGFDLFAAVCGLLTSGLGIFSIASSAVGLLFSWVITFFIGRALLDKSSFARTILILVTALFTVLGTLGVGKGAWTFVQTFELRVLAATAFAAVSTWMYAKSFRVLTDSSVKAYIG
jgi:hypothetical protein